MMGVSDYSQETCDFIQNHIYVNDGLRSAQMPQAAIEVLFSAKKKLSKHNICSHMIISNHSDVF